MRLHIRTQCRDTRSRLMLRRLQIRLSGDEGILPAVAANGQILLVPLPPMALQPAIRNGSNEGTLAGVMQVVRGSMFEAAGRVRVGGESIHGDIGYAMLLRGEWLGVYGMLVG